jgi:hypothetical protein
MYLAKVVNNNKIINQWQIRNFISFGCKKEKTKTIDGKITNSMPCP